MKLTALTPIKLGTADKGIQEIAEGESFEVDDKTGQGLVTRGAASAGSTSAAKDAANARVKTEAEAKAKAEADAKAKAEVEAKAKAEADAKAKAEADAKARNVSGG